MTSAVDLNGVRYIVGKNEETEMFFARAECNFCGIELVYEERGNFDTLEEIVEYSLDLGARFGPTLEEHMTQHGVAFV